jgi:hypothetical protein
VFRSQYYEVMKLLAAEKRQKYGISTASLGLRRFARSTRRRALTLICGRPPTKYGPCTCATVAIRQFS